MSDREIYVPPQGPPSEGPSREIYARMGEEAIFRLLEDFYAELGESPIRSLFPEDLKAASRKSAMFFTGLLGGPPLYHQAYGPPRMRARHIPFEIDEHARQVWLACFNKVLDQAPEKYGFPPEHLPGFRKFLEGFSAWMVNKAG
jgi:hemoglobin